MGFVGYCHGHKHAIAKYVIFHTFSVKKRPFFTMVFWGSVVTSGAESSDGDECNGAVGTR